MKYFIQVRNFNGKKVFIDPAEVSDIHEGSTIYGKESTFLSLKNGRSIEVACNYKYLIKILNIQYNKWEPEGIINV